jgi:hypothetical protein
LYRSSNIIRVRWEGHVACRGEKRNAHGILMGKPEGQRLLGRCGGRWEDNIESDVKAI